MSNKPRLSTCMIVKNEAELLPACLDSICEVSDEIIVMDTGSTDATIDIAKQYGAHVEVIEWKQHFGDARNEALKLATGDWILSIDADERLTKEDTVLLRSLLDGSHEYEGWFLQVEHFLSDDEDAVPISINPLLRLFRNREAYRFEGAIHEQIAPVILRERPEAVFGISRCRIRHLGYQSHIVMNKNKIQRNIALLEHTLETEGREPFHLFNLAVEKLRLGSIEEALSLLIEAKAITPFSATFAHLMIKYEAMALAALGRFEEAIASCRSGLRFYPDYSDLYFAMAHYEEALGQRKAAVASLKRAIEVGPPPNHYHTESGLATYRSHAKLASWALEERRWREAEEELELALKDAHCPVSTWLAVHRLQRLLQHYSTAADWAPREPYLQGQEALTIHRPSTSSSQSAVNSSGAARPSESWLLLQSQEKQRLLQYTLELMQPLDAHPEEAQSSPMPQAEEPPSKSGHNPELTALESSLQCLRLADGALARLQAHDRSQELAIAIRLICPIGAMALTLAEARGRIQ